MDAQMDGWKERMAEHMDTQTVGQQTGWQTSGQING